jgi:hypothetical protein
VTTATLSHGTYAGWNRHQHLRTPVCDACREAQTLYVRDLRRRNGACPVNFPREVRADLRDAYGLGARIAESIRWAA